MSASDAVTAYLGCDVSGEQYPDHCQRILTGDLQSVLGVVTCIMATINITVITY